MLANMFVALNVSQIVAAISVIDSAREHLAAEWEHVAIIATGYALFTLGYMHAFLTAIYDLSPDVHFPLSSDGTVMLGDEELGFWCKEWLPSFGQIVGLDGQGVPVCVLKVRRKRYAGIATSNSS